MKKYIPHVFFSALTLFWVIFIFANSAQSGVESGELSSSVLDSVKEFFAHFGIELPISEHMIRKLAHFTEYALLSVLICVDLSLFFRSFSHIELLKKPFFFLFAPAFCALVALADEFIVQALSEGRGPSFFDVCIDTSGALCGAMAFVFVIYIVSKLKSGKRRV